MSPGSCRFIVGNDTLEGQLMNSRLPRRIKLPAQTFLSLPGPVHKQRLLLTKLNEAATINWIVD